MCLKMPAKIIHFTSSLISAVTICLLWGAATFIVGERTAPWLVVNNLCLRVQQTLSLPLPCIKVDARGGFSVPDRAALWHIVNDLCLPTQRTLSLPLPCLKVDTERGFAEIRAPLDETQILIVPTTKIEGIESPVLLQDSMPNLWSFAWNERSRVTTAARRPLDWSGIGMVINSKQGRMQDQLHIHVDCVDARLKRALASYAGNISTKWSVLDLRPWADQYRIKSIDVAGLNQNIFKLIAEEVPGARSRMALQTIGVVGLLDRNGERGFAVLVNSDGGTAEKLLDHTCSNSE
jgi:CDP-diacylglycerol pyrophosphatase